MDSIVFMQINCQKSKVGSADVTEYVSKMSSNNKEYLFLLQEPNSNKGKIFHLPKRNLYFNKAARPADRVRTAILSSQGLDIWPHLEYTNNDVTTVVLKRDSFPKEIFIISAYFDINGGIPEILERALVHCNSKQIPHI